MNATPDNTLADPEQIIVDLRRQLAESKAERDVSKAERDEALQRETATAEVLQVINSSPGILTPVFEAMLEKAIRLCGGDRGVLWTIEGGRGRLAAARGLPAEFVALLRERGESGTNSPLQRVVQGEWLIEFPDTVEEFSRFGDPHAKGAVEAGVRSAIWVAIVKEGVTVGAFAIGRSVIGTFSDKQIALLQNFAAQAVVAMENARLLTETREALEQQTATAEVLQVINGSRGNLAPVFDAILEKAHSLCDIAAGSLELYDGQNFRAVAMRGVADSMADQLRQGYPASDNPATRPLIEGQPFSQILDVTQHEFPFKRARGGARTLLCVPLRRDDKLLGMIACAPGEVRPFTDKQIALLQNFAAQAVIAMENARLITEQREALEQQTATAEVLQVINASPGNLGPVFDAMLEKALDLCGGAFGILLTYDGELFHHAAFRGIPPAYVEFMREHPPIYGPENAPGRLSLGERLVHVLDVTDTDAYRSGDMNRRAIADLAGARTLVAVPLRKDSALVGAIVVFRQEVRPFSDKQIALLENFAAQGVIAMENARLINEQREALEQQTVTAEVLQVINASPGNLAPVFDAMLDKAIRLCNATYGHFRTYDGEGFPLAAIWGDPSLVELARQRMHYFVPGPHNPISRFQRGERLIHISDAAASEAYRDDPGWRELVDTGACRSVLAVALRKDAVLLGYISVYRREVRPFSDKQIALLQTFAAQAVIAMENARLLDEIRQRQEELRVTFENMGDGVAMYNETQHLVAWNSKFQEIFDLPDILLEQHRTYEEHLRFLAARGDFGANVDTAEQIHELVASTGQPYGYERTRPDGRVIEIRRNPVPDGGFVLIFSDITERKRSEAEIRAARDAAEEASRTIEAAYRDLKTAQANLIQAEKMASLGQLTAGIAHEIKNPLNFVNNFAALSVDLLSELKETAAPGFAALSEEQRAEIEDVSAMLTSNLEKITEHGKRADGIVKAMLEHSRGSSGERRKVDLNALIDDALNLAYHGARAQDQCFNVTLDRDFGEGIAPIEVNPQDMTRVFLNIFSNGFYAATRRARDGGDAGFEPALKVTTRDASKVVEIRVRDNGTGIPADIRDKLFQPFFTTKPTGEGTGLGLSITYDIVTQQHGGSIAVDSKVGEYSEFTIRLPRDP